MIGSSGFSSFHSVNTLGRISRNRSRRAGFGGGSQDENDDDKKKEQARPEGNIYMNAFWLGTILSIAILTFLYLKS